MAQDGHWGATTVRLRKLGWRVLVVWKCETRDARALAGKVKRFMK